MIVEVVDRKMDNLFEQPDEESEIDMLYHELDEANEGARLVRPILEAHDRNRRRIEKDIRTLRRAAEARRKGAA